MSETRTIHTTTEGSYRMPRFEHARVADVMRIGTLTCPANASLREVARTMASHHIHSVVVQRLDEAGGPRSWQLLSDLDLVRAPQNGDPDDLTAGEVARSEPLTVTGEDSLERATQLMTEHATAHLIVVDPHNGLPIGMVSSLDVAGTLAWGLA